MSRKKQTKEVALLDLPKPEVKPWNLETMAMLLKTSLNANANPMSDARCSTDLSCGYDVTSNLYWGDTRCNRMARLKLLDTHLASLRATVESYVNLIMSQKFTSDSEANTEKLYAFLQRINVTGESNLEALINGLTHAMIYGRCGCRFLSETDGWIFFDSDRYTVVYQENEEYKGFAEILGYVVARLDKESPFGEHYELKDRTFEIDFEHEYGFNETALYLQPDQFYNFYFYGDQLTIDTPLNHDVDRIDMFLALVLNMKQTIDTSNSDVQLVTLAEDLYSMNTQQLSELIVTSKEAKDAKNDSVANQVKKFADEVTKATKQKTLVVPPVAEDFKELGAKVEIKDFLSLYDYIESFITRLYGLSTNVLNLEKMPRDASANPIFEQMMKTSVYPKRELVEVFLNSFLVPKLGIGKVSYREESYARGLRAQTAQSFANVVSTLANANIVLDQEKVINYIEDELLI